MPVAGDDRVDGRVQPGSDNFEAELFFVVGERRWNVSCEEQRDDLTEHGRRVSRRTLPFHSPSGTIVFMIHESALRRLATLALLGGVLAHGATPRTAVLVSANAEWRSLKPLFAKARVQQSPYGEYFFAHVGGERVLFFHGGWGKIAAAASTQYVIDRFGPKRLVNLGTCGGVEGRVNRFDVVAVERVVVYDIAEAMGDSKEAIADYSTALTLPVPPVPVVRATMYSADRDLTPRVLQELEPLYRPVVADWESGAIAWVAAKNKTPLLILRGVSDLVGPARAEAEGDLGLFQRNTERVMQSLVRDLPQWLLAWR